MGSRVKLPELRALVVMLKSSVGSVCVLLMLVGEGSCQYYRGVYPAHTAPLHHLSYQPALPLYSFQGNHVSYHSDHLQLTCSARLLRLLPVQLCKASTTFQGTEDHPPQYHQTCLVCLEFQGVAPAKQLSDSDWTQRTGVRLWSYCGVNINFSHNKHIS